MLDNDLISSIYMFEYCQQACLAARLSLSHPTSEKASLKVDLTDE